jgi:hypothetical protein
MGVVQGHPDLLGGGGGKSFRVRALVIAGLMVKRGAINQFGDLA